jgi:hypothetical protein
MSLHYFLLDLYHFYKVSKMIHLSFYRASGIVPKWEKYWDKAQADAKSDRKQVSIVKTLFYVFGPSYSFAALVNIIIVAIEFA